jgi:hypothetical protein
MRAKALRARLLQRYLREPKTRFSVGRLFPLPRQVFHLLEESDLTEARWVGMGLEAVAFAEPRCC